MNGRGSRPRVEVGVVVEAELSVFSSRKLWLEIGVVGRGTESGSRGSVVISNIPVLQGCLNEPEDCDVAVEGKSRSPRRNVHVIAIDLISTMSRLVVALDNAMRELNGGSVAGAWSQALARSRMSNERAWVRH
jgi:hypothetical protein